jgi:hypothetical protein
MKNVDGPAVRLVDETDQALAAMLPESLSVQLGGIAEACREGLLAVAVVAGLATALAIMTKRPTRSAGAGTPGTRSVIMCGAGRHRRRW